jgi:conjugative relaxase-like TrwC/TraI family protein
MLSIGRIGSSRKQQLYYEEQVAKGREDYYAGRGEAPGRWTGKGAELLGLAGDLDVEGLKALMDGRDPATGERLAAGRRTERSTSALDLTFSAPKSVSVLVAIGDPQLSAALISAHEEAVDAAVAYIEQQACQVRRGHNGTKAERDAGLERGWEKARAEPAGGFVGAAYRHRMSRAEDPQLHTHVVVANMARGEDGRWTALYAKPIYEHAKAGGTLYQAHLRHAVRERVRWAEWGAERNGMAELAQVPAGVVREFSTRRRQIEQRVAELAVAGMTVGAEGYQRVALDTRDAKREIDEHDWRAGIRARAAEHGLGADELAELGLLPVAEPAEAVDEKQLTGFLFGPGGLTARQNTFTEQDLLTAVAAAHAQGGIAVDVIAVADRMLQSSEVVRIPATEKQLYTTRELLEAERRIVAHATDGRGRQAAILDPDAVRRTLERRERPLTGEQAATVTAIAASGNRIDTVEALAGTGKTTTASALRGVYEQRGYRVLGAAPTGRAVRELAERGGIAEARTLDAWALKLAAEPDTLRSARIDAAGQVRRVPAVMIIDEAGMAHTRLSAQVIDAAIDARVKVIAIGDSGQLSSVQAGGWLGALTRMHGSHELVEVMRQHDPHERKGLARLHRGSPDEYLDLKSQRGELRVFDGKQPGIDAEQAVIEQWASARDEFGPDQAVLVCRNNARRDRLNHAARLRLAESGELGEAVEIGDAEWAVGDRVIARRNDRGRDLDNGMRGTVTAVDEHDGLTIRVDAGEHRQLDPDYVSAHLEHAYALTGHGMQGGTVEWAAVIGQAEDFSRNWSYTALSRARQPTRILVIDEPTRASQEREEIAPASAVDERTPIERLATRMQRRDDEDLALEQLEYAQQAGAVAPEQPSAGTPDVGIAERGDLPPEASTASTAPILEQAIESAPSSTLSELATVRQELAVLRDRLDDPAIAKAREIAATRETTAAISAEAERDHKPAGRRDRGPHQARAQARRRQLDDLASLEQQLLADVPSPEAVLEQAAEDRERQGLLIRADGELNRKAVAEELAANPPWLHATLGPEPDRDDHRIRWLRTGQELASNRIERQITDPTDPGVRAGDHALSRSIADTRGALGLDLTSPGHEHGQTID